MQEWSLIWNTKWRSHYVNLSRMMKLRRWVCKCMFVVIGVQVQFPPVIRHWIQGVFDGAQKEIFKLLERNLWEKFRSSELFATWQAKRTTRCPPNHHPWNTLKYSWFSWALSLSPLLRVRTLTLFLFFVSLTLSHYLAFPLQTLLGSRDDCHLWKAKT